MANSDSRAKNETKKKAPAAGRVALLLLSQGVFLAVCGLYGAASHDWSPQVMHSAYAGAGCAAALGLCAALVASGLYTPYMIGVHVALLLQALFVAVFGRQTFRAGRDPAKAERLPLFVTMWLGSVLALAGMVLLKPKKEKES